MKISQGSGKIDIYENLIALINHSGDDIKRKHEIGFVIRAGARDQGKEGFIKSAPHFAASLEV